MFKQTKQKRKDREYVAKLEIYDSNFKNTSVTLNVNNLSQSSLSKIEQLCKIPEKNESVHIVTKNAINSFDFIVAISRKEHISEMYLAVYRIGKKVINILNDLINNNKIDNVTVLINDGFPKLQREAYMLMKSYERSNFKIKLENNHTKIIAIKTENNCYTIEGSGNLSINARIEQYVFCNDEKLYTFHKNWIEEI